MKNLENQKKFTSIAEKWQQALENEGYEHHISVSGQCKKLKRFSRLWRRIFKVININPYNRDTLSVFEVGYGGVAHLIQFALNNWKCVGIDCSGEVLKRAQNYIKEVSVICQNALDINLVLGDFLNYDSRERFDIVFHVGVLEHFLDEEERLLALEKMFKLTKPGGYTISVIPSGIHPMREKMKKFNLGGYKIPEIDYTPSLITEELQKCGGKEIIVLSHNILGYFLMKSNFIPKIIYYFFQLMPAWFLSAKFKYKHAGTFIGIAKK
jgi:2-polyprenyl-3-methyl-5-hydroxy-6-metoxy-1,4-benzoquinol methylase